MKNLVLLGFVGAKLDENTTENCWIFWRPTVAMDIHEELLIKRFELSCEAIKSATREFH